jgi:hypothetical protein
MLHEALVFLCCEWTLAVMVPVPLGRRLREWLPPGRFCDSTRAEEAASAAQELRIMKRVCRSTWASPSIGGLFLVDIRPKPTNGI